MSAYAYLLDSQMFDFVNNAGIDNNCFFITLENSKVSKCNDSGEGQILYRRLQNILEKCAYGNGRTLKVIISKRSSSNFLVILEGGILRDFLYTFGDGLQFKVEISNATVEIPCANLNRTEIIRSTWQPIRLHKTRKSAYYESQIQCPNRWKSYWDHDRVKFFGTLRIELGGSVILNADDLVPKPTINKISSSAQLENIKKMLNGQIEMDAVIVASDGTGYPCHSAVLINHSPVLKSMLEGKFKEAKTKRIEMKDMSSSAVKELLAFLYYWDLDKACKDSRVALELLQCAHKYSIQKLEADVKSIILGKGADWMDIAGAIRLFFFARNVETLASLRRKAISNLRSNRSKLVTSPEFSDLLMSEPKAFKILNDAIILYDD